MSAGSASSIIAKRVELLRHATALLVPLDWEEPFGLVMIEAMLVGTPVVAYARGSAPELVDEGVTGYVVDDVDAMAAAIPRAARLDRRRCRARALRRFHASRMVRRYESLYGSLMQEVRAQRSMNDIAERLFSTRIA